MAPEYLQGGDSTSSLSNPCQCSDTCRVFQHVLPALVPSLGTSEHSPAPYSSYCSFRCLHMLIRTSPKLSFFVLADSPGSQSFIRAKCLDYLCRPSPVSLLQLHRPHTEKTRNPDVASPRLRIKAESPTTCWQYSSQCTSGYHWPFPARVNSWLTVNLASTRTPKSQSCLSPDWFPWMCTHSFLLSFACCLAGFDYVSVSPFLQPSKVLLDSSNINSRGYSPSSV